MHHPRLPSSTARSGAIGTNDAEARHGAVVQDCGSGRDGNWGGALFSYPRNGQWGNGWKWVLSSVSIVIPREVNSFKLLLLLLFVIPQDG